MKENIVASNKYMEKLWKHTMSLLLPRMLHISKWRYGSENQIQKDDIVVLKDRFLEKVVAFQGESCETGFQVKKFM